MQRTPTTTIAAMAAIAAIGFSLNACEEKDKASKPTEAAVQQETPEPAETPKTADIAEMSPTFGRLLNRSPQGEAEYNKAAERYSKLSNPENPESQKLSPVDKKFLETFDEMFGYWDAVSGGCSWYCGGSVSGIAASSALKPYSKTLTYDARNIHDFDLRTAWLENSRVKKLKMLVNGKPKAILNLADRRQELTIKEELALPAAISFNGSAEIYGISLEGKSRISVDNIPWRGNKGTIFTELDSNLLKQSYDYVNAKLIILQFGGNFLPKIDSDENVKSSVALIAQQIRHLQKIYPSTKILLEQDNLAKSDKIHFTTKGYTLLGDLF